MKTKKSKTVKYTCILDSDEFVYETAEEQLEGFERLCLEAKEYRLKDGISRTVRMITEGMLDNQEEF